MTPPAPQASTPAIAPTWPRAPWWTAHLAVFERVTVAIIALALIVEAIIVAQEDGGSAGWAAVALGSAATVAVFLKPHVALGLFAATPLIATAGGWDPITSWTIACFGAFLLTLRGLPGSLTAVILSAANFAAVGFARGTVSTTVDPESSIAAGAAIMMAAAGAAIRANRMYWQQLEERARETMANREAAIDRGVAEERLRIARDLHDSVGHQIAVVSMHLGAAEVHLPSEADASRADLSRARAGVQSVLVETQQILQVLRLGTEPAALSPTPEFGQIHALIESYRLAGLEIEATLPDLAQPLAQDVSAAAYRITQEALTNAHKYGTGTASLTIALAENGILMIDVVNLQNPSSRSCAMSGGQTRPPVGHKKTPSLVGGNGLVGMRERAASVGGTLDISIDDTLYWVHAELPTSNGASA